MTLEGHNMPLFTLVHGQDLQHHRPRATEFETDGIGSFVKTVCWCRSCSLASTPWKLSLQTQGDRAVSVRTSVEVADIVTRPTDEVFADLITANQLTVVWKYDNETSSWASYDPMAPAELNDLELVSTADIVWVQVTESVQFQGGSLFAGWNLISLE